MMKKIAFLILVCLAATSAQAQFDVFGNRVPRGSQHTEAAKRLPNKPNLIDSLGRKQGEWARKYPNGRYMYEATFVDNKPVGTVTRYHENGKKSAEQTYNNTDTCRATLFDERGKKEAEGIYVNEQREGKWTIYDTHGRLLSTEQYSRGRLDGATQIYYSTGELFDETQYANGVKHGEWKQYFKSGRHHLQARYNNGKLHGWYRYWDQTTGEISVEGVYKNGVRIGDWKVYDVSGKNFFLMKYDNAGNLTNEDEVNAQMQAKYDYYDKNRKFLQDPEHYVQDPEQYRP